MESTNKSQTNRGKSQPCFPLFFSASSFLYVVHLSVTVTQPATFMPFLHFSLKRTISFCLSAFWDNPYSGLRFSAIRTGISTFFFDLPVLHQLIQNIIIPACFFIIKRTSLLSNFFVFPYSFSLAAYIYLPIITTFLSCKILCLLRKINVVIWLEFTI